MSFSKNLKSFLRNKKFSPKIKSFTLKSFPTSLYYCRKKSNFCRKRCCFAGKVAFILLPANCLLLPAMLVVADKFGFSVAGKRKCCRLSKIYVAFYCRQQAKARKFKFPLLLPFSCRCLAQPCLKLYKGTLVHKLDLGWFWLIILFWSARARILGVLGETNCSSI